MRKVKYLFTCIIYKNLKHGHQVKFNRQNVYHTKGHHSVVSTFQKQTSINFPLIQCDKIIISTDLDSCKKMKRHSPCKLDDSKLTLKFTELCTSTNHTIWKLSTKLKHLMHKQINKAYKKSRKPYMQTGCESYLICHSI